MTSALIGISADNGKQWHFVDGSSKGDLASILPDVKQLNVPQATQPVKWPTEFILLIYRYLKFLLSTMFSQYY
jgi:hypothetical protein